MKFLVILLTETIVDGDITGHSTLMILKRQCKM